LTAVRARRGRRYTAVDVGATVALVGTIVKYFSLAFVFPTAVALGYGESPWPFVGAAAIAAAFGFAAERAGDAGSVGPREGFLAVALLWALVAAFGAIPYLLSGEAQFSRPVDAYFEGMSGFTTTGASIVPDVSQLPRGLAMWRQFTIWLGGMGIIVLALAVLPRLRVGGRQFFEMETAGPTVSPLTTTIRETARRFLGLYVAFTAAQTIVLTGIGLGDERGMSLFEAVGHSFATLGTGGFSTETRSFERFDAASQWTTAGFMILAGSNYALLYRGFVQRRGRAFLRDEEFRLYGALLALGSSLVLVELLTEDVAGGEAAVRHAVFQASSIMTTTGFASTDFSLWPVLAVVTLVGLMFAGASAGSTSGSVKVVRHLLIGRMLRRELDQTVHPELVTPVRLNGSIVDELALRAVIVFVLLYIACFALGALVLVADAARTGLDLTAFEAIASAATAVGNVGPAVGVAGPMGSYEPYSDLSTIVLTALMWLGRLEIVPIVVLFTRAYWRA
jgi:trk system potassium uptake protein TrkH